MTVAAPRTGPGTSGSRGGSVGDPPEPPPGRECLGEGLRGEVSGDLWITHSANEEREKRPLVPLVETGKRAPGAGGVALGQKLLVGVRTTISHTCICREEPIL